jgi:hypothetical protein
MRNAVMSGCYPCRIARDHILYGYSYERTGG